MTNGLLNSAPVCCPQNSGGDLVPLLLVVIVLLAGHVVYQEFKKRKGTSEMKSFKNLAVVAAVVVAAGIVFALKHNQAKPSDPIQTVASEAVSSAAEVVSTAQTPAALPRLLELGADKCIPCKMMAPILAELRQEYAGQLQVDFIDVWKNENAGEDYGVRVIPLQIFFGADGRELFRHEGFFAKEDILAKWRELGVELQ